MVVRRCLAPLVTGIALCGLPAVAQAQFSWSAPSRIDNNGLQTLQSVTCASSSLCVTVDSSGQEMAFSPSSPAAGLPVTIDAGADLWGVSCPSTSQCTAVDAFGQEVTFDPASPGSPVPVSVDDAVAYAVACPSTAQCTAVDADGQEVTFDPASPANAQPREGPDVRSDRAWEPHPGRHRLRQPPQQCLLHVDVAMRHGWGGRL
jgi:hypothetical protein